MAEGNGAPSPLGVEMLIGIEMAGDPEEREQYVRELSAFALGNALILRAEEYGVDAMATLDEVSDLLGGKLIDHVQASALIQPILDRLLAKVLPR